MRSEAEHTMQANQGDHAMQAIRHLLSPVKGAVLAFMLVTLGGALEVTGSEGPSVSFSNPPASVQTYDFAEIVIQITNPNVVNPFTDASVRGWFVREGSPQVQVDGFCDSTNGSVFRIRFMPSSPGRHNYSITYSQRGLDRTQTGSFDAVASGRKGMVRVDPANRWHFIWEGTGEHYFWNGTTGYYLMGWDDATIRQNIDRLAGLKINRIRALVYGRNNPTPWGTPIKPTENFKLHLNPWPAERPDDIKNPGFDLGRFNVDHWRKYERMLLHAREKDVNISVIFFIGAQILPTPFAAGSEEERMYYRYGVARLAAFSNVMWDLGNEYNFHRNATWASDMGNRVKGWDPYDHLTSAHNAMHLGPSATWSDMQLVQSWFDNASSMHRYMLDRRASQRSSGYIIPVVIDEWGYEHIWDAYPGYRSADTRRKTAWGAVMAGGYRGRSPSAW